MGLRCQHREKQCDLREVRVVTSSGLQVLPQLALEEGYVKDEGPDVTIQLITGGQETLSALNSGEIDMGTLDSPSLIQGHISGVPIEMVVVPVTKLIVELIVARTSSNRRI